MKVCDKTCIFFFFPIINKYFLMAKRSLLSRCLSQFSTQNIPGTRKISPKLSMPEVGFEPTISTGEQPQTYCCSSLLTSTVCPLGQSKFNCMQPWRWCPQNKSTWTATWHCFQVFAIAHFGPENQFSVWKWHLQTTNCRQKASDMAKTVKCSNLQQ